MKIRKAVITAAGWGTRFLPATKAQPKETLTLVDKPVIQYTVEEAVASGIEQIIIVTALGKHTIENHFDRSFELEYALRQKRDEKHLQEIQRISELANICYIRQKEQLGLGHAVSITKDLIGNEPFALFLPDDIIESEVPAMKQLLQIYERYGCSVIAVEAVAPDNTSAYGIITPKNIEQRLYQVVGLVEKPQPKMAPSNLGIVGRYILTPEIFTMLDKTPRGAGGEIQLTDGLQLLLEQQSIYAYQFQGIRHDTGTPLGLLKASVELALRHSDFKDEFIDYLRQLTLPD
ncbi:MAG: UTP--glucose-1-phosphate uridylyltransferase GalU [Chloroflexota bacterium]|nr:UTP--glucose-1-phosphate uridylyltransferase GalU [Chloroflexota bacterium]